MHRKKTLIPNFFLGDFRNEYDITDDATPGEQMDDDAASMEPEGADTRSLRSIDSVPSQTAEQVLAANYIQGTDEDDRFIVSLKNAKNAEAETDSMINISSEEDGKHVKKEDESPGSPPNGKNVKFNPVVNEIKSYEYDEQSLSESVSGSGSVREVPQNEGNTNYDYIFTLSRFRFLRYIRIKFLVEI